MDFYDIFGFPNPISNDLRTTILNYSGNETLSAETHCINLKAVIEEIKEAHEDVLMKLFIQSLTEDAIEWYRSLPHGSLGSWQECVGQLIEHFGGHNDHSFSSYELTSIKKNQNETIL